MKAYHTQRILLYAVVLPFALLTFAWYVMRVTMLCEFPFASSRLPSHLPTLTHQFKTSSWIRRSYYRPAERSRTGTKPSRPAAH